ncbi:MAG: VWA domain-containing protein [Acidobacteria bacterium]|jgi:VWFA-related protein|nr:VWA domain-containing protein [Acidobacteriota bacterium]
MLAAWMVWGALVAQQAAPGPPPQQAPGELPVFRAETTLALVRFHVVRKNAYVDDLKPADVVLLEDGSPRKLTLFEGGRAARRTVPVEVILLFDTSGSVTQEGLLDPLAYQSTLLDGAPNARLAVYGFDSALRRFSRPTRDPAELAGALERVVNFRSGARPRPDTIRLQLPPKRKSDPRGGTWIYESVLAAAKDAAAWPGNATRMLVVLSDGFSTTTSQPEDAASLASELGIPIYPVVLGHHRLEEQMRQVHETGYNSQGVMSDGARQRLQRLEAQERDILDFARLGELTGGRSFNPRTINLTVVRQILAGLLNQIRCEYVVGFTPGPPAGQPLRHKLQVKLRGKELGKVLGGARSITY